MKKELLPDYAKPFKTKGYDVREVNGVYRLVKISSKRVPGKNYPVLQQEFIGIIDKDKGLIPKKVYPNTSADSLEYGLSHFLLINFKRDLQRSVFNGDKDLIVVKLGIIYYIYGYVDSRVLKLSYLTYKEENLLDICEKISEKRLMTLSSMISSLLEKAIPSAPDRFYITGFLRQVTLSRNTVKTPDLQYPQEMVHLFEQYGLKYE